MAGTCASCGGPLGEDRGTPVRALRPGLAHLLAGQKHGVDEEADRLCGTCLARLQHEYVRGRLARGRRSLGAIETEIAARAADHATIAAHPDAGGPETTPLGARVADRVAEIGGSWAFVLSFLGFLAVWMFVNVVLLATRAFDPYPFILLNLVLSCVAALQAPIILMSQNRAAARDRARAEEDYRVNLKAELEVAALHEKLDHLVAAQWEGLLELQEEQLELLERVADRLEARTPK